MESENRRAVLPRTAGTALIIARIGVGTLLAFGALKLLLHGRGWFARAGRPDSARVLLAGAEIAGAFLFAFRRTAAAGALVLLVVLAWAAGFHFALGQSTRGLWLDFALVGALWAASSRQA